MIKRGKKAQMQISFGMIFSIILVVVFLAFAFYAIKTFLNFSDDAKAAKFLNEFQGDVDRIWSSAVSSETIPYTVPGYVDSVCFIDFSSDAEGENSELYFEIKNKVDYINSNFVFYPIQYNGYESAEIQHIDIEKTTIDENPLCIKEKNGKISPVLRKDYGEALVTVEEP